MKFGYLFMNDHHMNIFRSYNHALIENNLTRAFMVTLRFLSSDCRNLFLKKLFKKFNHYDFKNVELALQGNIPIPLDKIRVIPHRIAIALIGFHYIENLDVYKSPEKYNSEVIYSDTSHPWNDAWIIDGNLENPKFCFMFECKGVGDILTAEQIIAYSKDYLRHDNYSEFQNNHEIVTWYDVFSISEHLLTCDISDFERNLLYDFIEYLKMNNVVPFKGFNFHNMPQKFKYKILFKINFNFKKIPAIPDIKIIL